MRILATVAMVALLLAVPTNADATTAMSVPVNLQPRVKNLCTRVPNLLARTDAQMTRLPSGPTTVGSIAWVKSRAQIAETKGRKQIASQLNTRAEVLTQKLALLPNQKAALENVQQTCQQLGYAP